MPSVAADMPLIDIRALLLERDDMDAGVVQQLKSGLAESPKQFQVLRQSADTLENNYQAGKGDKNRTALKLGIASFLLGRMDRSATMLEGAKSPLALYYRGLALTELGRFDEAMKSLESAGSSGYAASEVRLHKAAALRGLARFDEAIKELESLNEFVRSTAEYLYQYATILCARGDVEKAIPFLERAVEADPRHAGALFQLAYYNDRFGNDDEAINYYERCLQVPPARLGTLVNLGILYEDSEQYGKAAFCFEQVLRQFPNHGRARLFFKDAEASRAQYYDEDAERRSQQYNAVLDIPVTDFELSVRSRNCLMKMDISKLGDLTRCSEQQLLASKNFGETSLMEIKQMLSMKGLRLGQALEASSKRSHPSFNMDEYSAEEQAHFSKPVSELNLSVRARKCMNRLGITTVGELVSHSGDELLECKNFGVTSLVEVRDKLTALGLKLRGD